MKKSRVILGLLLMLTQLLVAQNKYIPPDPYTIQANKLHFSKYLITSPAYLGPNALPVPRLSNASVIKKPLIELDYEQYRTQGETTHDLYAQVGFPVARGKASFVFSYVPYEFYITDSVVSRLRRTESGEAVQGVAHGDVYFGARAQLVRDQGNWPDVVFGMYARTASGTKLEDARYTDTPGYYLDLTLGKSYQIFGDPGKYLRWFTAIGFYVWQTYLDNYPQNDALLYGFGTEIKLGKLIWLNTLRGFNGYMDNGDHPLVYRSELTISEGLASLVLGYEYGIRDYPFQCFRAGIRINGFKDDQVD